MDYDVRGADVWRSKAGRDARVEDVSDALIDIPRRRVTQVLARLKTGAGLRCEVGNFVRGRTLVERGGVRVGDVYDDAGGAIHVASIEENGASVLRGVETGRVALSAFASMRLIERDGKAV